MPAMGITMERSIVGRLQRTRRAPNWRRILRLSRRRGPRREPLEQCATVRTAGVCLWGPEADSIDDGGRPDPYRRRPVSASPAPARGGPRIRGEGPSSDPGSPEVRSEGGAPRPEREETAGEGERPCLPPPFHRRPCVVDGPRRTGGRQGTQAGEVPPADVRGGSAAAAREGRGLPGRST